MLAVWREQVTSQKNEGYEDAMKWHMYLQHDALLAKNWIITPNCIRKAKISGFLTGHTPYSTR